MRSLTPGSLSRRRAIVVACLLVQPERKVYEDAFRSVSVQLCVRWTVLTRGIALVDQGHWAPWAALRPSLRDVPVTVLPKLAHGHPVVRTQRGQALAVEQTAVDQCLLTRRTHSTERWH